MGGLKWSALPTVVEILGIVDVEAFIARLVAIRDWQRNNQETD